MSAEDYNRIRRILFSTVHDPKKGFETALEFLEKTYRYQLGPAGYVGMRAELAFYQRHRAEFALTVAGDMGEHADFAGVLGGEATRFDVTTNISFKRFADYEPYMGEGLRYKIALMDSGSFEIVDVFDLAFRICEDCGRHRIPSFVLFGQNLDANGEGKWTNDQLLIDVCLGCERIVELDRFTTSGLLSIDDATYGTAEEAEPGSARMYALDTYKYLRRRFAADYLMAVGSPAYRVTSRDGDGLWEVRFAFVNRAVANEMPVAIKFFMS
jgi:hypothetical protein